MKNKKKNNIIAKALLLPIIIANLNTNVFAINQNNNNLNNYTRETEYKADTWYYDFTPMPTPRLSVGAVTVGTKIYTIGGYNNNGVTDTGQFPATYYHPKVIVEVGACNSTTRSFRLPFSLLPQTWATIGSMT